ncbi:hypothetical protein GF373_06615, partial [bacterium]|nr:hypothetical protein [bacterium]
MQPSESLKPNPGRDLIDLKDLPFYKWLVGMVFFCALVWGVYFESNMLMDLFPIGAVRFFNYFTSAVYGITALTVFLIAGTILIKGIREAYWGEAEIAFFYGDLAVGGIFLATGLQFLLVELWGEYYPFFFLL